MWHKSSNNIECAHRWQRRSFHSTQWIWPAFPKFIQVTVVKSISTRHVHIRLRSTNEVLMKLHWSLLHLYVKSGSLFQHSNHSKLINDNWISLGTFRCLMAIIRLEMASVAIYGHYYDANTMMGSKLYALIFHPYNKREGTLHTKKICQMLVSH